MTKKPKPTKRRKAKPAIRRRPAPPKTTREMQAEPQPDPERGTYETKD